MNCYECGGVYQEKSDLLDVLDPYVGKISVQGVPYYQCNNCQDILYTDEMSLAIETKRKNCARLIKKICDVDPATCMT